MEVLPFGVKVQSLGMSLREVCFEGFAVQGKGLEFRSEPQGGLF